MNARATSTAHYHIVSIAILCLLSTGTGRAASSDQATAGPPWLVIAAPTAGWLKNELTFPLPVGREANGDFRYDDYDLIDDGWGGGLTLTGFFKQLSLTNVFFYFPAVNHATVLGNITFLSWTYPTNTFVKPYLGLGALLVDIDADISDFHDTRIEDLGSLTLIGYASMESIAVDVRVLSAFPKVGLRFNLPIQHWYLQPFYSYMYENVRVQARSSGGAVELYEYDPATQQPTSNQPTDVIVINPFDTDKDKTYHSHRVGLDFLLDFHYFAQLRGGMSYSVNHDLWTVRLIGTLLLNQYVGITASFEYSEKITLTNTYVLVGPAFVFSPPGYFDSIMPKD